MKTQVNAMHYFNIDYDTKERFLSYYQQINLILSMGCKKILEIGIGNSFVANYLKSRHIDITTLDIDPALNPDYVGSVVSLPFDDNSYELVACFEVLEHLPFNDFPKALSEMKRVTSKFIVISIPNASPCIRFQLDIPRLISSEILIPIPYPHKIHKFDGQHYWEMNKRGYSYRLIKGYFKEMGLKVLKTFRLYNNPYHHFFILEKKGREEIDKKIAIITSSPGNTIGGGQISAYLLSKWLSKKGLRHIVFTCEKDFESRWGNESNIIKYRLKQYQQYGQPITIAGLIARQLIMLGKKGINIFHVYNIGSMGGAGLYKLIGGKCKVIATLNSYLGICPIATYSCNGNIKCSWMARYRCLTSKKPMLYKLLGLPYSIAFPVAVKLMKRLDGYIAISEAVKKIYVDHGYKSDRIRVIPNFPEHHFQSFNHNGPADRPFNVLYVGQLADNKGVQILLKAFIKMVQQRPDVKLTIVGDGPLRPVLENLILGTGIENKVLFTGRVSHSQVMDFYRQAHVFVHPGLWHEPFGRTLLEAMSVGLPCVVSDVGAPPEIVGDAGLVFPAGDENALADLLIRLYDNPELRLKLSSNCEVRLKNYDPEKIVNQIIEFYEDVLNDRI